MSSFSLIEIRFSIKSQELADIVGANKARRKKRECKVQVKGDVVSGNYYGSEYDEYGDWDELTITPMDVVPSLHGAAQWLLDVTKHGFLMTDAGYGQIEEKIDELEKSIVEYSIEYFQCDPYAETFIQYQGFDGTQIKTEEMGAFDWERMWSSSNKSRATSALSSMGYDIDEMAPDDAEEWLSAFKGRKEFFQPLLDAFGHRKITRV